MRGVTRKRYRSSPGEVPLTNLKKELQQQKVELCVWLDTEDQMQHSPYYFKISLMVKFN